MVISKHYTTCLYSTEKLLLHTLCSYNNLQTSKLINHKKNRFDHKYKNKTIITQACLKYIATQIWTHTDTQFLSRKLPFGVIWQLGGVNIDVVVAMDTLNHLPLDLELRFLFGEIRGSYAEKWRCIIFSFYITGYTWVVGLCLDHARMMWLQNQLVLKDSDSSECNESSVMWGHVNWLEAWALCQKSI